MATQKAQANRTIEVRINNGRDESHKPKSLLDLFGVFVSPTVALLSAGVAAWAGIETQRLQQDIAKAATDGQIAITAMQTQSAAELETLKGDYERRLQELQNENQASIAKLQEETKLAIAENEEAVSKSTVFSNMIESLSDPQKAGFALLALWQLNSDPKDRNLISAAALATPSGAGIAALKSLALIDDDVKVSVQDLLSRASASGNEALASTAEQVVGVLTPDAEVAYLLQTILADEHPSSYPISNDYADQLMKIAAANSSVHDQIAAKIDDDSPVGFYLRYVLYKAGQRFQIDEIVGRLEKDSVPWDLVDGLLSYGDFEDDDVPRVVSELLRQVSDKDPADVDLGALYGLRRTTHERIDAQLRNAVVTRLTDLALKSDMSERGGYVPAACIEVLYALDPAMAVRTMSSILATGGADSVFIEQTKKLVDGDPSMPWLDQGGRPRDLYPDLPQVDAPSKEWAIFRETQFSA